MSRKAREKSELNIYHVVLRCVDNETFFRKDNDKLKLRELLNEITEKYGCIIYAYYPGNTEIHLLLKPESDGLEIIFKFFCVKYVYWYNCKYRRRGKLFYDRFISIPVNDDNDFDASYSYIAVKSEENNDDGITSPKVKISHYKEVSVSKKLADYINNKLQVRRSTDRITEEEAIELICEKYNLKNYDEISGISSEDKYRHFDELLKCGASYRQISRLMNVSYLTIKNHLKDDGKKIVKDVKTVKAQKKKASEKQNNTEKKIVDFFAL